MSKRIKSWVTPSELWAKLKPKARQMRREPTPAEAVLWKHLRGNRIDGLAFRRQHPLDRFIVDFFCPTHRLVIEVDGDIHLASELEDRMRQDRLEQLGYTVVRFRNEEVLNSTESVLQRLREFLGREPE